MGEMKKTNDSCVLYGVPKVHFAREVDGQMQNSPFPMCLQAVLNYMGQHISYTEIMAYSGAAFRQRWDSNGWNIAAIDIRFTYERHLEAFERAFHGVGRKVIISENPDMPKEVTKGEAIELIKSELDCGRPVIALGVVGPPEACVITGYRNNGETLLGWSLFQDFWGGCEIDESGYFIKENWWEETEAIMSIGEEIGNRTTDRDVLENALMLMTTDEMPTYGANDIFYGGQTAYEAWASALEDEFLPGFEEYGDCQNDAEKMLGEDRRYAAMYMNLLGSQYPNYASELNKCSQFLMAAADCTAPMRDNRENPQKIATLVRQAAKHEKDACDVLTEIIGKMYDLQNTNKPDLLSFGNYTWRVLDVEADKVLVIAENVIEKRAFHNKQESVTWENSQIRKYLNGTFYNKFSPAEQSRIIETRIPNPDNPWYGIKNYDDTLDKIFLLSYEELVKYFGDSGDLKNRKGISECGIGLKYGDAICDKYNEARKAFTLKGHNAFWWLRSPGGPRDHTEHDHVTAGSVDKVIWLCGDDICRQDGGVRPALWLSRRDKK
jgi:hypothetical protein